MVAPLLLLENFCVFQLGFVGNIVHFLYCIDFMYDIIIMIIFYARLNISDFNLLYGKTKKHALFIPILWLLWSGVMEVYVQVCHITYNLYVKR